MTADFLIDWAPLALLEGELLLGDVVLLGLVLFLGTTALVALCIPGVILPLSVGSGALLGGWFGAVVVGLGVLAGSQILFVLTRRAAPERWSERLRLYLGKFERGFAAYGIWYVLGLRLIGAPHFLVTASSAILNMKAKPFAAATLLGMLPQIAIAAATGSLM